MVANSGSAGACAALMDWSVRSALPTACGCLTIPKVCFRGTSTDHNQTAIGRYRPWRTAAIPWHTGSCLTKYS